MSNPARDAMCVDAVSGLRGFSTDLRNLVDIEPNPVLNDRLNEMADYMDTLTPPSLANFNQAMRPYQMRALIEADRAETPKVLLSLPTGTGKGSIELQMLKNKFGLGKDVWIVTPSLEIIRGFVERCGHKVGNISSEKLAELGEMIRVTTPVRFRNRIEDGVYAPPDVVIYDEVHHAISENAVSGDLFALAPLAKWVGFTATPYRATPKATARLRRDWGDPIEILSIPEAIASGYWALPYFEMAPLVDDDVVEIRNGRFVVKSLDQAVGSRVSAISELVASFWDKERLEFDVPTCLVIPSTEIGNQMLDAMDALSIPAFFVNAKTATSARQTAYDECASKDILLIVNKVIGEGFDAPWLGHMIDASPTASPVTWVQRIGRLTRPKDYRPVYTCTNRNLERFAWLLQGAVPSEAVVEAQRAFDKPSKRTAARALGLEGLERFKAIEVPLSNGGFALMYYLYAVTEDGVTTEYAAIVGPEGHPITAMKEAKKDGQYTRDKWKQQPLPDLQCFARTSQRRGALSEKQANWWKRAAKRHGLDPSAEVNRRQFQALPLLSNLKASIS